MVAAEWGRKQGIARMAATECSNELYVAAYEQCSNMSNVQNEQYVAAAAAAQQC